MSSSHTISIQDSKYITPTDSIYLTITSVAPIFQTISLGAIFSDIDANNDGTISPKELGDYLRNDFNMNFSNKRLMEMFNCIDDNNDLKISWEEFFSVMEDAKKNRNGKTSLGDWKHLFNSLERDKNQRPSCELFVYEIEQASSKKIPVRVWSTPVRANNSCRIPDIEIKAVPGKFEFKDQHDYYVQLCLAKGQGILKLEQEIKSIDEELPKKKARLQNSKRLTLYTPAWEKEISDLKKEIETLEDRRKNLINSNSSNNNAFHVADVEKNYKKRQQQIQAYKDTIFIKTITFLINTNLNSTNTRDPCDDTSYNKKIKEIWSLIENERMQSPSKLKGFKEKLDALFNIWKNWIVSMQLPVNVRRPDIEVEKYCFYFEKYFKIGLKNIVFNTLERQLRDLLTIHFHQEQEKKQVRFAVFGYGSNKLEQIQERCQNKNIQSQGGYVQDYVRAFAGRSIKRENSAVATIVKDPGIGKKVYGTVVYLTMAELKLLDGFEGCGKNGTDPSDSTPQSDDSNPNGNSYRREKISIHIYNQPKKCILIGLKEQKLKKLNGRTGVRSTFIKSGTEIGRYMVALDGEEEPKIGHFWPINIQVTEDEPLSEKVTEIIPAWTYIRNKTKWIESGANDGKPSPEYLQLIKENIQTYWKTDDTFTVTIRKASDRSIVVDGWNGGDLILLQNSVGKSNATSNIEEIEKLDEKIVALYYKRLVSSYKDTSKNTTVKTPFGIGKVLDERNDHIQVVELPWILAGKSKAILYRWNPKASDSVPSVEEQPRKRGDTKVVTVNEHSWYSDIDTLH